ncbi:MAG: hypothetical protein A2857_06940 [Candidatus Levybacteria bacterium RIFCSPHIGHO2_01_FULL_36_15]|nr:MAG: hypothetical protein A2857_06940 [Candidatus Levybacteria bacterium RIFCSPHIGHO2_01_FULL_36_15]OGH38651.1 MAG: hypothetical protein A2905_04175 [Candidatus Levybacteria bacterium RIFCSPLOWO2_01_FULL_36_10]
MFLKSVILTGGIITGILIGYFIIFYTPLFSLRNEKPFSLLENFERPRKQVIGFLPYWLASKAKTDYSKYITMLSYFSLTLDDDGKILKLTSPIEEEPGWYALRSGKLDKFFKSSKEKNVELSLVVFNGNQESINNLISNPLPHAQNLIRETVPIMKEYGFTDLNLDIESTSEASDEARTRFVLFVKEVKKGLQSQQAGTLTIDISPIDFVKKNLVNPKEVAGFVDRMLLMGYDYHYTGSYVTGPVAPLYGAGSTAEFDIQTAIEKAQRIMPKEKIILGMPLYGYEWESINNSPRSGIIPGTGLIASNLRVEQLLASCATCSGGFDEEAQETYIVYKDEKTNTYHQIFYPDKKSSLAKISFAENNHIGGIALWALGYEGATILEGIADYNK